MTKSMAASIGHKDLFVKVLSLFRETVKTEGNKDQSVEIDPISSPKGLFFFPNKTQGFMNRFRSTHDYRRSIRLELEVKKDYEIKDPETFSNEVLIINKSEFDRKVKGFTDVKVFEIEIKRNGWAAPFASLEDDLIEFARGMVKERKLL